MMGGKQSHESTMPRIIQPYSDPPRRLGRFPTLALSSGWAIFSLPLQLLAPRPDY
jgi:hypothetical protein